MTIDLPGIILFLLIVLIIVGVVLVLHRKRTPDPTWQTDPAGKVEEEAARLLKQARDLRKRAEGWIAAPAPAAPVEPTVAATVAPAPAATNADELADAYIDRDDLMVAIGATGYARAVTIDGVLVHNGLGPVRAYTKQESGNLTINRQEQ